MNHTQRIAHVARQQRKLTKAIVRKSVELYLEALANEIADGEWVDIKGIGKMQVIQEEVNGLLTSFESNGGRQSSRFTQRLRTKIRIYKTFKDICKEE